MADHEESKFEAELCEHLEANGWLYSATDAGYDRARALYPEDIWEWLAETQSDELQKVSSLDQVLDRIVKVLDGPLNSTGGTLNLLRRGFQTGTASFSMVQVRPETDNNAETTKRYAANRVRVMRQVHYSLHNQRCIDLVFFVNGLPVATVELKTDFTQTSGLAVEQYRKDRPLRDPATNKFEPLLQFGRRALVHFAISNIDAQMTTHLRAAETSFLPFNTGDHGGAGNPANLHGSATAYLWERVWQRDSWLRILLSFMHLHAETKTHPITGETTKKESMLFPRFHQWEAVSALVGHARDHQAGHRYLVQHSAGSGKSNSIAWLAHQLSTLHDAQGAKVFRSVIVVTDRNVLDTQLRETIKKIDHKAGVVVSVGDDPQSGLSKSQQLAHALRTTSPIITVTIQTFPYLGTALGDAGLTGERFAIIADEAHSSQTGVAAAEIKKVLTPGQQAELDDGGETSAEDLLAWAMEQKSANPNISYFAFTATPKNKTLELFGTPDADGRPRPFHLYTMRQAIEEGFILDVLDNYTPYETAFKLKQRLKSVDGSESSAEVDQSKASKELMRWVRLHPTNISQKVQIVVEHFRTHVRDHLGGHAKAMVVTGSRKEALRYKLAMDAYIAKEKYDDVATLVAFSGSVDDPDSGAEPFTESSMNPALLGRSLPKAFAGPDFNVMIVANKFQTGFDQPLLVAMYVDKRLDGVTAVQTLSRLNRTAPGKDSTYVLDFVNDPDVIVAAFKPYYEEASLSATTDPDLIHDLRNKLDASHVYTDDEVDAVAAAWVADSGAPKGHERLQGLLAAPRVRFTAALDHAITQDDATELERLGLFRKDVDTYVKLYDFLSQVINYGQTDLEKRAIFFRLFARLIRQESIHESIDLSDVVLANIAHKAGATEKLDLGGDHVALQPLTGAGSGAAEDPVLVALAEVIRRMNEVFDGGSFDETDIGALSAHVVKRMLDNPVVRAQVDSNTQQQVIDSPALKAGFVDALVEAQSAYSELVKQLFDGETKRVDYFHSLISLLYLEAQAPNSVGGDR